MAAHPGGSLVPGMVPQAAPGPAPAGATRPRRRPPAHGRVRRGWNRRQGPPGSAAGIPYIYRAADPGRASGVRTRRHAGRDRAGAPSRPVPSRPCPGWRQCNARTRAGRRAGGGDDVGTAPDRPRMPGRAGTARCRIGPGTRLSPGRHGFCTITRSLPPGWRPLPAARQQMRQGGQGYGFTLRRHNCPYRQRLGRKSGWRDQLSIS